MTNQPIIRYARPCLWIILLVGIGCGSNIWAAPKSTPKNKKMTEEQIRRYNIRRFDIHNLSIWGGAGYSALLHANQPYTNGLNYSGDFTGKWLGGGGGLLGIGYEYNYRHFLLSVGPEFRLLSSMDALTFSAPYEVSNLQYGQTKRYYLSNANEYHLLGQIMLPVLLGGKWDKFYFMAGAKVGYTMLRSNQQKMDIQTSIIDPQAYEEWQSSMSNHYNTVPQSVNKKSNNPFGLDVALSAEVGINLDQLLREDWRTANEKKARPNRMRLAVFADYGIYNMSLRTDQPLATTLAADAIETQSWLRSEWGGSPLNSLLVGVKFTYLLQMNKVKPEKKLNGYLAIHTFDEQSLASLAGVAVQVKNVATKKVNKRSTSSRGLISRREPQGEYAISAQCKGYQSITNMPFTHGEDNDTVQLAMAKMVVTSTAEPVMKDTVVALPTETEQPVVLEDLYFATNKTTILPQSEPDLLRLFQLLSQHPNIRIRITGHTDNVGSMRANQLLSEGRANSVRQNMIDRGIEPSRIEAEGKGELQPIDTNDTEEGRQNNRRVEFIIL